MVAATASDSVPLPGEWPEQTRSGFLQALGLLRVAVYTLRGWAENSPLAKARLQGEVERLETEVALLKQELRLKDARMARIEAARRPHYTPVERLEILMLGVTRGWWTAELARRFLLTAATIAHWNARRDQDGPDALLQTCEPVNKFPEFVTALVQQLQTLVPIAGRRKLAEHLARAGLHLSASTVKRRLEAQAATPKPPAAPSTSGAVGATPAIKKEAPRAVAARGANHVWGADLTLVPLLGGFAVPWLPFAWTQRWPFCWWALLVVDHFSRSVVHVALFAKQPKEAEVVAALEEVVNATGPPKHSITDQGVQFQSGYRGFCQRHGIRHRYGAIGKYGSIAVVERLNRTLKREGLCQRLLPLAQPQMLAELRLWQSWYNECRPHARWHGATPAEVRDGRLPAAGERRFETRKRWPRRELVHGEPGVKLALDVTFVDGRRHLPVVALKQAA